MNLPEVKCLRSDFGVLSHFHQLPPDSNWTTWLLLGGRGAGKTRAGAEWVRGIALAFGVPPMLLEIPGDNTYSNYQEANRVFWRQTVLPLAGRIACALSHWLEPSFGQGLMLSVDTDVVDALAADRAALWERSTPRVSSL